MNRLSVLVVLASGIIACEGGPEARGSASSVVAAQTTYQCRLIATEAVPVKTAVYEIPPGGVAGCHDDHLIPSEQITSATVLNEPPRGARVQCKSMVPERVAVFFYEAVIHTEEFGFISVCPPGQGSCAAISADEPDLKPTSDLVGFMVGTADNSVPHSAATPSLGGAFHAFIDLSSKTVDLRLGWFRSSPENAGDFRAGRSSTLSSLLQPSLTTRATYTARTINGVTLDNGIEITCTR
jgi:hypothetical protein